MANNAASMQLPIMVRKPKMVWPGLDKEGLHLKSIAGDGNCLFASLSDQLYGTPDRHGEIRATVIEHMRAFRPLYEDFVNANDVIHKRATRATTESIRKQAEEDAYEGYLAGMSRTGAYGGQPELLAFVRSYQQDVMVHLPPSTNFATDTLPYNFEERDPSAPANPPLHICYGGDEDRNAHYDSSQRSDNESQDRPLASRPKVEARSYIQAAAPTNSLSPRALRNIKSDPTRDMMHEFVTRGSRDLRANFDDQRARSPSVTSSHYSTSSKRSFEDDGDQPRASKRADRKRRSLRSRAAARQLSASPRLAVPMMEMSQHPSSGPPTPTSSHSTDSSVEQRTTSQDHQIESAPVSPREIIDLVDDDSDYEDPNSQPRPMAMPPESRSSLQEDTIPSIPSIITESSSRPTLQT